MRRTSTQLRRVLIAALAVAVVATGVTAVALAAGGAHTSVITARLQCPKQVRTGRRVTCRIFRNSLRGPRGPRGFKGIQGTRGKTGKNGNRGPTGPAGVSGYQVVTQTFNAVSVPKSEGGRGLSVAQTVNCPSGKRVVGGGTDLGTNEGQASAQRDVSVSLSGPNGAGTGWSAQLFNASSTEDHTIDLRIFAICARA